MTKEERMFILAEITQRLDRIIELLENKNKNKSCEPLTTFVKANANANDSELKSYEMEIFQMLDNQRRNKNDR